MAICCGERADVNDHLHTKRCKASVETAASSSREASFFKHACTLITLALAAKWERFVYHTAPHERSFKNSDGFTKLTETKMPRDCSRGQEMNRV